MGRQVYFVLNIDWCLLFNLLPQQLYTLLTEIEQYS